MAQIKKSCDNPDVYLTAHILVTEKDEIDFSSLSFTGNQKYQILAHEILNSEGIIDTTGESCTELSCPLNDSGLILDLFGSYMPNTTDTTVHNLMKPGDISRNQWVNMTHYKTLTNNFENQPPVFAKINNQTLVSGYVDTTTGELILNTFYTVPSRGISCVKSAAGDRLMRLFGSSDEVITEVTIPNLLELTFIVGSNQTTFTPNRSIFFYTVNKTNLTRFEFVNITTNETIIEINITPNTPGVALLSGNGGELFNSSFNITWNASDADNDTIYYAILISDDAGSSYTTIDFDINKTYYTLNNADFTYGTDYKVKVLATDGVNTGTAVSNGTFTIEPPPSITVTDFTLLRRNGNIYTFEFTLLNNGGKILNNSAWKLDAEEANISSTIDFTIDRNEEVSVIVEYNSSNGDLLTITAFGNNTLWDVTGNSSITIDPPSINVVNFTSLHTNGTRAILEFAITNNGQRNITDAEWSITINKDNVTSNNDTSLNINKSILIIASHDFQDKGTILQVNANAESDEWNIEDTETITVTLGDIILHSLTELFTDSTLRTFEFKILNNLNTTLDNISWKVNTGEATISSNENVSLDSSEEMSVLFSHNYSSTGNFTVNASATNGGISDDEVIDVTIT